MTNADQALESKHLAAALNHSEHHANAKTLQQQDRGYPSKLVNGDMAVQLDIWKHAQQHKHKHCNPAS